ASGCRAETTSSSTTSTTPAASTASRRGSCRASSSRTSTPGSATPDGRRAAAICRTARSRPPSPVSGPMLRPLPALLALAALLPAQEPDRSWPCYRGPRADGTTRGATPPTTWSDGENLRWKAALPGPGASCPIVHGDRVYLTCYTGYGVDLDQPGEPTDLVHHVVAISRADGAILWDTEVPSGQKDAARQVQLQEHGFASP